MSSNSARECFVYITLPGRTSAITAGKFVLDQTESGAPLGRFVYGQSYLKNAVREREKHSFPTRPLFIVVVTAASVIQ